MGLSSGLLSVRLSPSQYQLQEMLLAPSWWWGWVVCTNTKLCAPTPIVETVQVLVVPEPGSDSATVSEDLADDCGLYSPMLSPRQQGAGGSGGSSSAEDLTIELTSPTGRSSDFFAPPAEMRAPALSPGMARTAALPVCML
jgi:hypothetical protein